MFAVNDFPKVRMLDLRDNAASEREALQPIGRHKKIVEPSQRGIGLIVGDEACFFVGALDRERRPDHPQRLKRFRSCFLASVFLMPLPRAICSTAV